MGRLPRLAVVLLYPAPHVYGPETKEEAMADEGRLIIGDRTKVGIAIPQTFLDGPADAALIGRHAARAEALGYDSLWVQHGVFTKPVDPFVLMTAAAMATSRVKVGSSVLVLPFFHPLHVAKASASIDQLSGGRLILGVGLGGHEARYPIFGIDPARRVRRFLDMLELIKRLWTEENITFDNGEWRLDGFTLEPKPVQQPHPPVWFGGRAEGALKRAVRLGDGFMGAGASRMDSFLEVLASLRKHFAASGRDPASFAITKRLYVAIDDDKERAERELRRFFLHQYRSEELGLQVSAWGTEDEVTEQVARLAREDLDMIMFNPVYNHVEHAERIAERIVPQL